VEVDQDSGKIAVKRVFVATIGNYDYAISWIFHQDGVLEVRPMDEFETSMKVLLRLTRKQRQRVPVPPGRSDGSGGLRWRARSMEPSAS
jgi:hypothetical protein